MGWVCVCVVEKGRGDSMQRIVGWRSLEDGRAVGKEGGEGGSADPVDG